jgi:hypothetical protein
MRPLPNYIQIVIGLTRPTQRENEKQDKGPSIQPCRVLRPGSAPDHTSLLVLLLAPAGKAVTKEKQ